MPIIRDLQNLTLSASSVVIIGKFDGVHLGHQAILQKAVKIRKEMQRAGDAETQIVALSFDPLPTTFFNPEQDVKLINTPIARNLLLLDAGAEICVLQNFNQSLADLSATDFVTLIRRHLNMKALVIGKDFALGKSRRGTGPILQSWGQDQGFRVYIVGDVRKEGYAVRSNTIRQLLQRGEVKRVSNHLGRNHFVAGQVKTGVKLARKLGFPTANLSTDQRVCYPRNGVYATWTWIQDPFNIYASVTNLGFRPTFEGIEYRVETHILDYSPSIPKDHLYGQQVAVSFEKRLRPEKKFETVEELATQVQRDILMARSLLSEKEGDGLSDRTIKALLSEENYAC